MSKLLLTRIEGVPDSNDLVEGMAYFPHTGPVGTTCGQCKHRGIYYRTEFIDPQLGWTSRTRKRGSCAEFKRTTGKPGPVLAKKQASCKGA